MIPVYNPPKPDPAPQAHHRKVTYAAYSFVAPSANIPGLWVECYVPATGKRHCWFIAHR